VDNQENKQKSSHDHPIEEHQTVVSEDTTETPSELPSENSPTEEGSSTLEAEISAKAEEIQNLNEKYLRLAAEFENYKRRAQREQNDTVRFANEKLLKDLLPTIDNLERAIQCGQEQSDSDGLLQGVELTYKQFLDTLEKLGVTQVTSIGEPFDPTKHQAVGQVDSTTVPENCVVDEYQKGYFLQDRILRPAMVTVAKAAHDEDSSPLKEETPTEE